MEGNVIGFSILKVNSLKDHPIEVALAGKNSLDKENQAH